METILVKSRIPGWLSKDEAKVFLNVQTTTLWKLMRTGQIRTSKIGKCVYYSTESIMQLIERNAQ